MQGKFSGGCIETLISHVRSVHAGVGKEDAFEAVEDEEERFGVEKVEELVFAIWGFHLAGLSLGLARGVGEGADDEVFPVGIGFVEAPPESALPSTFVRR